MKLFTALTIAAASCLTTFAHADFNDFELSIWKSERFEREFIESYMAVSDVEPSLTERERKVIGDIQELIRTIDTNPGELRDSTVEIAAQCRVE